MSVDASFENAVARRARGDLTGAAEIYQQLLSAEPDNYKALINLGRIYDQQGQNAEALEVFSRAVELAPDNAIVAFNYAVGLNSAGELDSARTAWQRVISLDPANADAHYNLAATHHRLDELAQAIEAYKTATRLKPDFYEAWSNLGQCCFEADAHLQSFEASVEASKLAEHPIDFFNMGRIAELLGDRANAARHYLKALELDPEDTGTRLRCAEVLAASGAVEDAIRILRDHPVEHPLLAHTLSAISGEKLSRVSADYVQSLFDGFAGSFDETLARLDYRGPDILRTMVLAAAEPQPAAFAAALDIGCGTGLLGAALEDRCDRLVGVDLSAEMLSVAESKGIYDALVEADLLDFLGTAEERFDLVTATDVFNYFGELGPLLECIARVLRGPKLLAFSVEDQSRKDISVKDRGDPAGDSYQLQLNGRYQHAADYVREQLAHAGYELVAEELHTMRQEGREPVKGRFFCARHGD